jgi:hypothetical protein
MEQKKLRALKARFTCGTSLIIIRVTRGIEARFQRLFLWESGFPGALPQADYEIAPLALNRCASEAHGANQPPPLMPAQPKNAEQPAPDRRGLRNDRAIQLDVVDDCLEIIAL